MTAPASLHHRGLQMDLFAAITDAYAASGGPLDNAALYRAMAAQDAEMGRSIDRRVPIGRARDPHSPVKRKIRWFQQTLKQLGVLERVPGKRGEWRLTESAGKGLDRAVAGVKLVAFSTDLGVAIWGRCEEVFQDMNTPISLVLTSPPYPLAVPRHYGNPPESAYVDFVIGALNPLVRSLVPGGSIVLNVSNDIHLPGSPARSLYLERLILALHDRLGLHLMDRIPWVNHSKAPAPTIWACRTNVAQPRVQLCTAWEPVLWLTNSPADVRSDNRRVLEPHTERHRALVAKGGEQRVTSYGDGSQRLRHGAYGTETAGRIPRNVFVRGHQCADTRALRGHAAEQGHPPHGASFPTALPDFFIRFLTQPGDLVVDPFGGSLKTGLAAERLGRRWMVSEWIRQYLATSAPMFAGFDGFRRGEVMA